MAETAAEKKKREAKEAAAAKAKAEKDAANKQPSLQDVQNDVDQANQAKAEENLQRPSDKSPEDRNEDEIKAAAATAAAKVQQEQYDAIEKANQAAQEQAESNDVDEDEIDYGLTDRIIQEKLKHGTTPEAVANENEDYVLKQQLYRQAGLSAPDVLATANAAAKVKAD